MVDKRRAAQVRGTVRRVRNYWYRAGVPRRVRRDKAEELRTHLLEALDDGRRIDDVVGRDLAAFASEWAEVERPRPLLDVFLQFGAALTLLPGGFALLNPWLGMLDGQPDPRIGVRLGMLALLAVFVLVFTGWQLVRVLRHRLTTQQTALVGVLLFVSYIVSWFLFVASARGSEVFVAMSPVTAWTLVALGVVSQGTSSWLKRRR